MPLFGSSSPFDQDVAKVTDEMCTKEDWSLIMDICDRVQNSSTGSKDCLKSISKRLNHSVPHVVMQTLTLLDACVKNCGRSFHLEVSSRDFTEEIKRLIKRGHPKVSERMKSLLVKWCDDEFASDQALHLIPSLYNSLRSDGVSFPAGAAGGSSDPTSHHTPTATSHTPSSATPAAASRRETSEDDPDLARAIELSLAEARSTSPPGGGGAPTGGAPSSLYPSVGGTSSPLLQAYAGSPSAGIHPLTSVGSTSAPGTQGTQGGEREPTKARALYDFEAAEDNELTFKAGEIVFVTDDSDANWWKGHNQRGEGLFPANFVTKDLDYYTEPILSSSGSGAGGGGGRKVQFSDSVECKVIEQEAAEGAAVPEQVDIDEDKIEKVLGLLDDADPTGEREDSTDMLMLEEQVKTMGPLIDQELEKIDKRSNVLSELNSQLMDAISLYHSLMGLQPPPGVSVTSGPAGLPPPGVTGVPAGLPLGMPPPPAGLPHTYSMPPLVKQQQAVPPSYQSVQPMQQQWMQPPPPPPPPPTASSTTAPPHTDMSGSGYMPPGGSGMIYTAAMSAGGMPVDTTSQPYTQMMPGGPGGPVPAPPGSSGPTPGYYPVTTAGPPGTTPAAPPGTHPPPVYTTTLPPPLPQPAPQGHTAAQAAPQ